MKLTKSKLKQLIKEELETFGSDGDTNLSPEALELFEEGKAYLSKLIEMGKKDDSEDPDRMTAAAVFDALEEWANEESFEHVRISSLY